MINNSGNEVPENTIAVFGYQKDKTWPSLKSLKGELRRDWFDDPYYFCLPITFANQLGFVVISLFDFTVRWDGGKSRESLTITSDHLIEDGVYGNEKQKVYSFFHNGTFTVSHDWMLKTPPGTNLYVTQPPNYFIPGVTTMAALIETDNLERDFTFTLKVTVPNIDINIKAGDMLAMLLPIPRYYPDSFELKDAMKMFPIDVLRGQINAIVAHASNDAALKEERGTFGGITEDEDRSLGIYFKGLDPYGNKFKEHQRKPKSKS
jgi:hypothetical protein